MKGANEMIGDLYTCEHCGTEFEQEDDCHWYCSRACFEKDNIEDEEPVHVPFDSNISLQMD